MRHDTSLGFEAVCLEARTQCNLRHLQRLRPSRVLEVGCGPVLLSERALPLLPDAARWVVVEPASRYVEQARVRLAADPRVRVIQDYIEQVPLAGLSSDASAWADVAVVSGVLHETAEPRRLLEATLRHLRPGGQLLLSVPNAMSFHRLLAVEMGLISDPATLSERNRRYGQPEVYSPSALRELIASVGLAETAFEGYLFKPFTHQQMADVLPALGEAGVRGLIELGRRFPEHAAETLIVAQRPDRPATAG